MSRAPLTALAAAFISTLLASADTAAQGTPLLRQPSVSAGEIAFVHANDVWVVARDGGAAPRLTGDEGAHRRPGGGR